MANLILPRRFYTQPQVPVELYDPSIVSFLLPSGSGVVEMAPQKPVVTSSLAATAGSLGQAVESTGASVLVANNDAYGVSDYTITLIGRIDALPGSYNAVFSISNAGTDAGRISFQRYSTTTQLTVYHNNSTNSAFPAGTVTELTAAGDSVLSISWSAQTNLLTYTLNGRKVAENTFSIAPAAAASPRFAFPAGRTLSTGSQGRMYGLIVHNRKLSDEETGRLHREPWSVARRKPRVLYFDVAGGSATSTVSSDLGDSYALRAHAVSDLGDSYAIRAAIAADLADGYSLRAAASGDLDDSYLLRAGASADLGDAYALRGEVSNDFADSYLLRNTTDSDLADSYALRANVASDLGDSYTLDSASSVGSNLADAYEIRAAVGGDLADSYALRASVSGDFGDAYALRSNIDSDLADSYDIASASSVGNNLGDSYTVRSVVSGDLGDSYALRSVVAGDLEDAWLLRSGVAADFVDLYSSRNFVSGDLADSYLSAGLVYSDLGDAYAIEGELHDRHIGRRLYTVPRENRLYTVPRENRLYTPKD